MYRRLGSWRFIELFYRYRSFSCYNYQRKLPCVTVSTLGDGCSMHQGLQYLITRSSSSAAADVNGEIWRSKPAPPPAPAPTPPRFNFAVWARWVLGSILSLLLPFWKLKWEKLKKIEGEAEMVVEEAETVAEVVEKVATAAEKLSADVADILPDHSKLKEAALFVERVSKETAHDAHHTKNFIHKVDELEQDLSNLETVVEPIVEKIVPHKSKVTNKRDS